MTINQVKIRILGAFRELFNEAWRYIIFYGGRSSGKSRSVATALLLRGRKKKLRILCTREIQNTIKDSVHKLLKDLIEEYEFADYIVTNDSVVNQITGTEFIFKGLHHNIMEIKSTEGIDICWVEEAQTVTEASWNILTPTIRKPGSQIVITFNRLNELDPVYVKFCQNPRADAYVSKVNYDALERAGLLPDVIKGEIENDREDVALFAHKWLGEPLDQSDAAIVNRTNTLQAMQRQVEDDGAIIVGADIARLGGDRIVFYMRKGLQAKKQAIYSKKRTPATCDLLEEFIHPELQALLDAENRKLQEQGLELKTFDQIRGEIQLKIDDTGVGGGVTDEMMKRGYNVVAINFGGEPGDKDKYPNWISEAWFHMAEVMPLAGLLYNSDMLMELTTRQWKMDNKGKRRVESKDDYKKRGFRSPDLADAAVICYGEPPSVGILDFMKQQAADREAAANRSEA